MRKLLQWVLREELDQNGWFLCLAIFWSSIFGVATSFNVALAVRLGATNTQVSWLASGGALLGRLVRPLAGRFLQARANHRRWVQFALLISRLAGGHRRRPPDRRPLRLEIDRRARIRYD